MKVLVTGANGYIGSKIVKQLCDLNVDVIATDFDNSNIDSRSCFIQANIFDDNANWFNFFDAPDVCIHLAWRDGFTHNSKKHILDLSNHYKFLTNLIDNGLKQVACMGTMHEIGYYEGKVDEYTNCVPLSNYGISKNALREALKIYCDSKNCKFQWLRAYYMYGDDTYGSSIFCKIRQAALNGNRTFPFTTGKSKFDFIHIDELAYQISLAVIQSDILGVINVCSGKPTSLADQVEWYIKHNNLPIKLEYGKFPDRPYDSPCIYGDNEKIQTILNNYKNKIIS